MKYTYVSAHAVVGIVRSPGESDIVLFDDQSKKVRVLLTTDAIAHLRSRTKQTALLSTFFSGTTKDSASSEFSEAMEQKIRAIEETRRTAIGKDPVVIIEIEGSIDAKVPKNAREVDGIVLCVDAFDKNELHAEVRPKVAGILAALRLGTGSPLLFRRVVENTFLTTEDGKSVCSSSIEFGGVRLWMAAPLSSNQQSSITVEIERVIEAKDLARVIDLHAQSFYAATDSYRAFVAAWAALEILIGKLFPTYQKLLAAELRGLKQSPGLHAYLDRIALVMSDKYKLVDKFAVLATYLDDEQSNADIESFKAVKRTRDELSHGEDIKEWDLPTKEVQELFEKYLRSHLNRSS